MTQGILNVCRCRRCKAEKRKGKVLGSFLLRHLGPGAYYVAAYVPFRRYRRGRARTERRELNPDSA